MSIRRRQTGLASDTCDLHPVRLGRRTFRTFSSDDVDFFGGWQPTNATRHVKTIDREESERVKTLIRAKPTHCWFNARKAIQQLDEYADALYVEGFAASDSMLTMMAHGWIVREGIIIDPTAPYDHNLYVPGLEVQGRADLDKFLSSNLGKHCKSLPFFHAFGDEGANSASFRSATEVAIRYMKENWDADDRCPFAS